MAVDIATLGIKVQSDGIPQASDRLKTLTNEGGKAETATNKLSSSFAGLAKYVTLATAAMVAWKLSKYIEEATMLAARVETLGVVMKVVGNNAGYTGAQMDGFVTGLKKMGITTQESMNSLIKMAGAQMDLTKASQLARIAQDAAVIGGINSSEAFGRMINGIRSGETEQLKGIGINVQQEAAQKKYAASLGKTKEQLTATEKTQAMLNAVLDYGKNIAGAYESAMSTAGKTMSSLARPAEEIKLLIGSTFTPALNDSVRDLYALLNNMAKSLENNKQILSDVGFWFKYIYFVGKTTVLELVNTWHLAELAANKFGEAIANALYLMQGGSLNGRNPFAGMVTWFAENTAAIKKDILENNTSVKKSWDDLANYGTTGRTAAQEQAAISESRARKERERREAMQATAAEQKKVAAEALKNLKEQETAFYDLGQEIERTSDTAARVFKIMTMGGGDLKTDRYNTTNVFDSNRTSLLEPGSIGTVGAKKGGYSLLSDTSHSIPQSAADDNSTEQARKYAQLMSSMSGKGLQADNGYDSQLTALKDQQDARLAMIADYAEKEKLTEEQKNAAKLASDQLYADQKRALDENTAKTAAASLGNSLSSLGQTLMAGNKEQFEAGKKMAIAGATIQMMLGAVNAFTAMSSIPLVGPALGGLAAAAVIAQGTQNIAMISSQQYEAREMGGPVTAGKPYIVGEKRAEVFVPNQSGRIIPSTGESQPVNVTQVYQISTGVADTVRSEIGRMVPALTAHAVNAVRSAMNQGQLQRA